VFRAEHFRNFARQYCVVRQPITIQWLFLRNRQNVPCGTFQGYVSTIRKPDNREAFLQEHISDYLLESCLERPKG
jgi:hypothetical protein